MIGDLNPFPFQPGGGPSRAEAAYNTLRNMVGVNGGSLDEESLVEEWRKSKAIGLAMLETFDESATFQAWPHTASDFIPVFERMLGISSDETLSDQERRDVIVPDYTGVPESWWSALQGQLQSIDSRATVLILNWENTSTTMHGRAFEQFAPVAGEEYDPGGPRTATQYPNYSDAYRSIVKFDIGNGVAPSREVLRRVVTMQNLMNEILPGWVDYRFVFATGFILDSSLLDATGFGT